MQLATLALFILFSSGPPNLSGSWAREQVTSTVSEIPVVGEVVNTTHAWSLLELRQRGTEVRWIETVCRIDLDSTTKLVKVSVDDAFLGAVSGARVRAKLARKGNAWWLVQPRQGRVVGAKLKRPAREALPTSADDPRVDDPDKDGHPGVTVMIRGLVDGDVYVVQRSWTELRGKLVPSGEQVSGRVRFGVEQSQLGETDWKLRDPLPSRPHEDPERHTFRMVRVPTGSTCKAVREQADTLFTDR